MIFKKCFRKTIHLTLVFLLIFSLTAYATVNPLRYSSIDDVYAKLEINNHVARCSGRIVPSGNYDCSITVTLYRQSGSKWSKVIAGYKSSTGGTSATLTKTFTLTTNGNYKVVTTGTVNGESCRAESKVVSYQGQ